MSSATTTIYVPTPSSAQDPSQNASADSPPIVELVRFLGHSVSNVSALTGRTLFKIVFTPFAILYIPLLYFLAPVLLLARILLDVVVLTPYSIAVSLARDLYPVYVFLASSIICASVVAMGARYLTGLVQAMIVGPPAEPAGAKEEVASVPVPVVAAPPKPRVKRVSIKEQQG